MAKANITQYSSTPSSNTDINNINIDENCPASGLNNAIRELMAHLKNVDTGSQALTALSVTGNATVNDGITVTDSGASPIIANRTTSDGTIVDLQKDGTSIGNIGIASSTNDLFINSVASNHKGLRFGSGAIVPTTNSGGTDDNATNLGGATQRFSNLYLGGGAYIGGTGSANYLDDYEEGDWTPAYGGASVAPTITYNTQKGTYIKVGQFVHLQGRIRTLTTSGGSGNLRLTGLPFPNINSSNMQTAINIGYNGGWAVDKFPAGGSMSPNTSHVTFYTARSSDYRDGLGVTINAGDLTTGTNNNDIIFSMTYRTDS